MANEKNPKENFHQDQSETGGQQNRGQQGQHGQNQGQQGMDRGDNRQQDQSQGRDAQQGGNRQEDNAGRQGTQRDGRDSGVEKDNERDENRDR